MHFAHFFKSCDIMKKKGGVIYENIKKSPASQKIQKKTALFVATQINIKKHGNSVL